MRSPYRCHDRRPMLPRQRPPRHATMAFASAPTPPACRAERRAIPPAGHATTRSKQADRKMRSQHLDRPRAHPPLCTISPLSSRLAPTAQTRLFWARPRPLMPTFGRSPRSPTVGFPHLSSAQPPEFHYTARARGKIGPRERLEAHAGCGGADQGLARALSTARMRPGSAAPIWGAVGVVGEPGASLGDDLAGLWMPGDRPRHSKTSPALLRPLTYPNCGMSAQELA